MVAAFDIKDVNPNPARFDLKKAEAINASHMRLITLEDMTERVIPFLQRAGVLSDPVTGDERRLLDRAMPLVNERMNKLAEAPALLGFLFADEQSFTRDESDVEKLLDESGRNVVRAAREALAALDDWHTPAIEEALRAKLVEGLGLKPRNAFGPVRVAVTGSRISPPLFESLELLGRERSLARLDGALA
jgi:glutamyl-tRNA synthetase